MARNDPFTPSHASVSGSGSTTFDGSSGGTGAAIISGIYGDFDAEIYLEDSTDGGSTWQQITQFTDESGNTTFSANWATQFNRVMVNSGSRRIRIDDVSGNGGVVTVDGDER